MAFGAIQRERRALEATYEDMACVYRMETRLVGSIDRAAPVLVHSGLPCALSRVGDRSKQTSAQQDIDYDCVLFMAPEVAVLPGDRVEVARLGRSHIFEAVGLPAVYATHQQAYLKGRDLA